MKLKILASLDTLSLLPSPRSYFTKLFENSFSITGEVALRNRSQKTCFTCEAELTSHTDASFSIAARVSGTFNFSKLLNVKFYPNLLQYLAMDG